MLELWQCCTSPLHASCLGSHSVCGTSRPVHASARMAVGWSWHGAGQQSHAELSSRSPLLCTSPAASVLKHPGRVLLTDACPAACWDNCVSLPDSGPGPGCHHLHGRSFREAAALHGDPQTLGCLADVISCPCLGKMDLGAIAAALSRNAGTDQASPSQQAPCKATPPPVVHAATASPQSGAIW